MKKYIITEPLVNMLMSIHTSTGNRHLQRVIESLKPIEPMTYKEIIDIISMYQEGTDYQLMRIARAVERHIVGSDE